MDLGTLQVVQAAAAAVLVGLTKTGVPGLGILIVPLMAAVFPAKSSVGVLLPMLLMGDVFAIAYYRRHANWPIIRKLLPWVLPGIVLGYLTLERLSSAGLGALLSVLVLSLIALKAVESRLGERLQTYLPHQWWFSAAAGVTAGFATMTGNVAGPIMVIYLLSMGQQKHQFMGTSAWFYFIVNAIKVPLHVSLGLINPQSLLFDAQVVPLIVLGALTGRQVFRLIPQKWFNRAILTLAALAALRLLLL